MFSAAVIYVYRDVRPELELFLPHRLDIDTSGLVIVGEFKPSQLHLCFTRFCSWLVSCLNNAAPPGSLLLGAKFAL